MGVVALREWGGGPPRGGHWKLVLLFDCFFQSSSKDGAGAADPPGGQAGATGHGVGRGRPAADFGQAAGAGAVEARSRSCGRITMRRWARRPSIAASAISIASSTTLSVSQPKVVR